MTVNATGCSSASKCAVPDSRLTAAARLSISSIAGIIGGEHVHIDKASANTVACTAAYQPQPKPGCKTAATGRLL